MIRIFNSARLIIADKIINLFSQSRFFVERFFLRNRSVLVKEIFEYPSIINNGYVHIDRVIAITKSLGRNQNKIILDIGAANGIITKIFASNFPMLEVYCFEPIHKSFLELKENMQGIQNVKLINKALGAISGETRINILNRITSSSLLNVSNNIDDPFFAESLREQMTEDIQISTLDQEIPVDLKVSIIKIDVQGYELEVLKGGIETLKRTDFIVLEMQNHFYYKNAPLYFELDNFLRHQQFICWDIIPSIRKNYKLMEWDAIFVSDRFLNELKT